MTQGSTCQCHIDNEVDASRAVSCSIRQKRERGSRQHPRPLRDDEARKWHRRLGMTPKNSPMATSAGQPRPARHGAALMRSAQETRDGRKDEPAGPTLSATPCSGHKGPRSQRQSTYAVPSESDSQSPQSSRIRLTPSCRPPASRADASCDTGSSDAGRASSPPRSCFPARASPTA